MRSCKLDVLPVLFFGMPFFLSFAASHKEIASRILYAFSLRFYILYFIYLFRTKKTSLSLSFLHVFFNQLAVLLHHKKFYYANFTLLHKSFYDRRNFLNDKKGVDFFVKQYCTAS